MNKPDYADIKPVTHDMGTLELMMKERNAGEIATLKTVNSLAGEPYKVIKKQQGVQTRVKNAGLYASFVLLLFTTMILFMSPMLQQTKYDMSDWRVWGIAAIMFTVSFAVAYVVDIGRSHILGKANNSKKDWAQYIFFGLVSIIISTTGLMALADFYESKQQTNTTQTLDEARNFIATHGNLANVTESEINAKRKPFLDLFALKGSGYGTKDKARDMARIDKELVDLQEYKNADALVNSRHEIKNTADSSNWLFNTYAAIFNTGVKLAAVIVGLAIGIVTEAMMLVSHSRLIKLNARLEVTEQQWAAATMAANEAMIVADSTIVSLNHIDYFAHAFKMPFNILNQYQNQGRKYGDFIDVEAEIINDDDQSDGARSNHKLIGDKELRQNKNHKLIGNEKSRLNELYLKAAETRSGEKAICPNCESTFNKSKEYHVFCGSNKANESKCKEEFYRKVEGDNYTIDQRDAQGRYSLAKNAKVGELLSCPTCSNQVKKKSHNSIFCSNKGVGNCKDGYHNLMKPNRLTARR